MGAGYQDHDLVFCEPYGAPLDPESVTELFDRRIVKSGCPEYGSTTCPTHVAHLIAAGEQPLLIARRLGHASATFTQDRYWHLFDDAGNALDSLGWGSEGPPPLLAAACVDPGRSH